MHDAIIFILILIIIYYVCKNETTNKANIDVPIYYNLGISDICKSIDKKETAPPELSECEKEQIKKCPPKKSLETQLFDQKKLNAELKLELENKELPYKNDDSDRYLGNTCYLSGSDLFATKLLENGKKNQDAIINRTLWTKNSFIPYLEEELQAGENLAWWNSNELLHQI